MRNLLLFSFLLLFGLTGGSHALTPTKAGFEVIVVFAPGSSELLEGEAMKLNEAITRVKREDWCALELVVAVGYAQPNEVSPEGARQLSEKRAARVGLTLANFGVQRDIIYTEGKGVAPSEHLSGQDWSPHVVVVLQGWPPATNCGDLRKHDGLQ